MIKYRIFFYLLLSLICVSLAYGASYKANNGPYSEEHFSYWVRDFLTREETSFLFKLADDYPNQVNEQLVSIILSPHVGNANFRKIYLAYEYSSALRKKLISNAKYSHARRLLMTFKIDYLIPRESPWQKTLFLDTWGYSSIREARAFEIESVIDREEAATAKKNPSNVEIFDKPRKLKALNQIQAKPVASIANRKIESSFFSTFNSPFVIAAVCLLALYFIKVFISSHKPSRSSKIRPEPAKKPSTKTIYREILEESETPEEKLDEHKESDAFKQLQEAINDLPQVDLIPVKNRQKSIAYKGLEPVFIQLALFVAFTQGASGGYGFYVKKIHRWLKDRAARMPAKEGGVAKVESEAFIHDAMLNNSRYKISKNATVLNSLAKKINQDATDLDISEFLELLVNLLCSNSSSSLKGKEIVFSVLRKLNVNDKSVDRAIETFRIDNDISFAANWKRNPIESGLYLHRKKIKWSRKLHMASSKQEKEICVEMLNFIDDAMKA